MAAGQPRQPAERMAEALPDHSALTRIRQRWGSERFRAILARVVKDCLTAGIVSGDVVHMDATLIRADVSLGSLVARHMDAVDLANLDEDDRLSRTTAKFKKLCVTDPDASRQCCAVAIVSRTNGATMATPSDNGDGDKRRWQATFTVLQTAYSC